MKVERLSPALGAVIHGLSLTDLTDSQVSKLDHLLDHHGVLFFRDQQLDPGSLLRLAARFGKPTPYPFVQGLDDYPEVIEVIKEPEDRINFGGVWHSDTAYLDKPAMGALLYAVEVPETGGDTLFADASLAYQALSQSLQKLLSGLTAINTSDKAAISATRPGQPKRGLSAEHPVIRTHPRTGRKILFVDRAHTTHFSGWTIEESTPLLEQLFDVIERPEHSCRFHWTPGSLAFWDNRRCQHYPLNDYHGERRRMLRVSLAGELPV